MYLIQGIRFGSWKVRRLNWALANRDGDGDENVTKPGGEVLSYMGYIGMCGPKGYGFSAVLVINRVSILADFGHK